STAFGYVEAGAETSIAGEAAREVLRFVEKPDAATARRYVEDGHHYWNLNLFCWRCDVFAEELQKHGPVHYEGLVAALDRRRAGDEAGAGGGSSRPPCATVGRTAPPEANPPPLVLPGLRR